MHHASQITLPGDQMSTRCNYASDQLVTVNDEGYFPYIIHIMAGNIRGKEKAGRRKKYQMLQVSLMRTMVTMAQQQQLSGYLGQWERWAGKRCHSATVLVSPTWTTCSWRDAMSLWHVMPPWIYRSYGHFLWIYETPCSSYLKDQLHKFMGKMVSSMLVKKL